MKYIRLISLICFLFTQIIFSVYSQTSERAKPLISDFGSSLNRSPEENLNKPNKKKVSQDADAIKIETNLVVVDFLVLNKKGQAIYGLKQDDFTVTEDNQPQEIQTFTLGDDAKIPRSIVLIIDYSGSLFPYIERSVEAAKLLVDKLRPNDLLAIVTDDIEIIAQFTSDKNLLKEKLESLKQNTLSRKAGKSLQFSSLYAVLNEMFDEEDVRPIILFQTDGDQFGALKGGYMEFLGSPLPPSLQTQPISITNFSFDDLLSLIEKKRGTVYTIIPGFKMLGLSPEEKAEKRKAEMDLRRKLNENNPYPSPKPPLRTPEQLKELRKFARERAERIRILYPDGFPDTQEILMGMSKYSGGWLDFLEKPEDADGVYSRILSEINTRYVIGYYPTNEAKDGKRRKVIVSVKNHPDYIVWGRKTYIAPLPD